MVASSIRSSPHAAHGVELWIGLEREVSVQSCGGRSVAGRVVVVPANCEHSVQATGPALGLLYDVEVFRGLAGFARSSRAAFALEGSRARRFLGAARAEQSSLFRADILAGLGEEVALAFRGEVQATSDRRVRLALDMLRDLELDRSEIITACGISEPHLQALFVRDVGITMRRFRLWQRMLNAVIALRQIDATRAAHEAGFADLAHFSRSCRRFLGYSPSTMSASFASRPKATLSPR